MKNRFLISIGVSIALSLSSTMVFADDLARDDPDDTEGLLDVSSIAHGHFDTSNPRRKVLTHHVETFDNWENDILSSEVFPSYIEIVFNIDSDPAIERYMHISASEDGSLQAEMFSRQPDRVDSSKGYAFAWRPDERSLGVAFPRSLLRKRIKSYRWYVSTAYHESGHKDCDKEGDVVTWCQDEAPNAETVRHKL